MRKIFSRDQVYVRPKGPLTGSLVPEWNALTTSTVLSVAGQMAH